MMELLLNTILMVMYYGKELIRMLICFLKLEKHLMGEL